MIVKLRVLMLQIVGMFLVIGLALFLAAGTISWVAGWVFLGSFFGFVVALSLWLLWSDPELLRERMSGFNAVEKGWDRLILALVRVLFLGWLIVMPLDAVRFGWSRMHVGLQLLGATLLLASYGLFFLTFRENSFLSPVVRVQAERGHRVISSGPYGVVRHPMYSAFVAFALGAALLLGSWLGVLGAMVLISVVARRAVPEEATLRQELPGYSEYMARVRHRFVPGLW